MSKHDLIVTRGDGVPLPDQAAAVEEFKRQCLSSRSPGCSNIPSELDVAEDKIQELEILITVIRADIRELYAMRGEDEMTAKYCNAILTATADI